MLSCREVTQLVAGEQLARAGLGTRLSLRLHLLMCNHCRKYVDQLRQIGRAARQLADGDPKVAAAVRRVTERIRNLA
jgi:hypothetical protein